MSNPVPKLILHSDQSFELTGERDRELLRSLTGKKNPRILYVPSVRSARSKVFEEKKSYYTKLGFPEVTLLEPEDLTTEDCQKALSSADVVHLSGGEVIAFAQRLKQTGCDELLREFVNRGGVILGVSAGAMILSNSFKTATLFRERGEFFGLGLIDFEIVPHDEEHFPRRDLLEKFAIEKSVSLYAMNDGDVVVVHGKKVRTLGAPVRLGHV